MVPFSFLDQEMQLVDGRALYWPGQQALVVADLHLEKASFFAGMGQMLPPYDSRETLGRLASAIRQTGALRVFALGDNFHDEHGTQRLEPHAAGMLAALTRAVEWIWITGNHDARLTGPAGGEPVEELSIGGLVLRHQARSGEEAPELSGHYHPKLTIRARGRRIARPCAVMSENRIILPAFGALTGGMDAKDLAIRAAMQPASKIDAVTAANRRLVRYPLWREQPTQAEHRCA